MIAPGALNEAHVGPACDRWGVQLVVDTSTLCYFEPRRRLWLLNCKPRLRVSFHSMRLLGDCGIVVFVVVVVLWCGLWCLGISYVHPKYNFTNKPGQIQNELIQDVLHI